MYVRMSGIGHCYGNAFMESFFSLRMIELIHHEGYNDRYTARTSMFDYIETFCKRKCIHGAIAYMILLTFELRWQRTTSRLMVAQGSPLVFTAVH